MDFDLRAHTHLLAVSGSRAYGLHTESSDVDLKGFCVPPARCYHGFNGRFEQVDDPARMAVFHDLLRPEEVEAVSRQKLEGSVYELSKLLRLASDCNPNALEILFCRQDELRLVSPLGQRLRERRSLLLSARARHTFGGYALGQLKRIRGHRRWLLDPPQRPPSRADYDLPERTVIPSDQLAAAQASIRRRLDEWEVDYGDLDHSQVIYIQDQISRFLAEFHETDDSRWRHAARSLGFDDNFMALLDAERRYNSAHKEWTQYQTWRRERNAARAELEARYGYDVKHAMHLVRLLRMGREILLEGTVHVWRGDRDAEELRAIRAGAWTYDELVAWAEAADGALERIWQDRSHVVPRAPDMAALDALCVELVEEGLRGA